MKRNPGQFQKFDAVSHIRGLRLAAEQIHREEEIQELIRTCKMPSLEQVRATVADVQEKYAGKILKVRRDRSQTQ